MVIPSTRVANSRRTCTNGQHQCHSLGDKKLHLLLTSQTASSSSSSPHHDSQNSYPIAIP